MGISRTPVIIRTPVKIAVDTTAIENAIMDKLAPVLTELMQNHVDFNTDTTEPADCDFGFNVIGTAVQDGTWIHIAAFDLNPPEDSVEPDDIPVDDKTLLKELQTHIIEHMSGDEWKRIIALNMSLQLDVDKYDRKLDIIED